MAYLSLCFKTSNMRNLFFVFVLLMMISSCRTKTGSGNIVSENRAMQNFTGVNIGGPFEATIQNGPSFKVRVEADDNIISDIKTEVRNGKLKVYFEDRVNLRNATMKIYVEAPSIENVDASAAADVETAGILKGENRVTFHSSSGAKLDATVDAPDVEAEASSGSHLILRGKTRQVETHASSGAELDADELLSENARADASSGASIDVHASVRLNAEASSGASVDYRGNPTVSSKASSGGSIKKLD